MMAILFLSFGSWNHLMLQITWHLRERERGERRAGQVQHVSTRDSTARVRSSDSGLF